MKFIVGTLSNQDNKCPLVRVDEDEGLAISSKFMKTCHNVNAIVQTTGGGVWVKSPIIN